MLPDPPRQPDVRTRVAFITEARRVLFIVSCGLWWTMAAGQQHDNGLQEPDALDQKGNRYYKRKLLQREFIMKDLMKLTFELPKDVSLKTIGFDIGLGDFVRMRPYAEEHMKLVENPSGGRAYSPVLPPDVKGRFSTIVRAYAPEEEKIVGVSSLLKHAPIGTELLISHNVEHVFWEERNRGYYCNERNIPPQSESSYYLGLISFGIGITEIAPVAMSELLDDRVKKVTILWANKFWSDAAWVWKGAAAGQTDDVVHRFFSEQGKYGSRLQIRHILSREERTEACFHGRINPDVLRQAFLETDTPKQNIKFLAVGTAQMIDDTYGQLSELKLDIAKKGHQWFGNNLLYRKCAASSACGERVSSPLLAATPQEASTRQQASDGEPSCKRLKSTI